MSRAERSLVGDWWWTVDRATLAGLVILMVAGLVLLMAGGPPVAERLGLSTFHFVSRQVLYLAPAVALMVAVSFLSLRHVRRLALLAYVIGMALVAAALQWGPEIKGAHRWISIAGIGLQPSEFVKPAFVVLAAWAFAEGAPQARHAGRVPGAPASAGHHRAADPAARFRPDHADHRRVVRAVLRRRPALVLGRRPRRRRRGRHRRGLSLPAACARPHRALPAQGHGRRRRQGRRREIGHRQLPDRDRDGRRSCAAAGSAPGPARASPSGGLPDAHTDFIFAVTGEEFGIIVCLALLALFAFIVLRGLLLAQRNEDTFCRLASTGLVMMFGLQAAINMAVNVQLMPAKGMTLPFISYGGSSLISLALGMGFLMALTRRRPRAEMAERLGSRGMNGRPRVLLAAGGTGGHLFPAEALANALKRLELRVALATDHRAGALAGSFPAEEVIEIASATPSGRSPPQMAKAALVLGFGFLQASRAPSPADGRRRSSASAAIPTVPPVIAAAAMLRIPTVIHEQNGVMGRANRFLAGRVSAIATGFPEVRGIPATPAARSSTPATRCVRRCSTAARTPYPAALHGGKLRLLVFGGSQGARVMSDIVPAAIERLPTEVLPRLVVTHQAREEDALRVMTAYARSVGHADVQPFFKDLPQRIAESHLVISRSGASTVAELAVIGRPSILVPLPGALDQDQAANARSLAEIGAATVIPQAEFTPERLAAEIMARIDDPVRLDASRRGRKDRRHRRCGRAACRARAAHGAHPASGGADGGSLSFANMFLEASPAGLC